jgi:hypothetical protein
MTSGSAIHSGLGERNHERRNTRFIVNHGTGFRALVQVDTKKKDRALADFPPAAQAIR